MTTSTVLTPEACDVIPLEGEERWAELKLLRQSSTAGTKTGTFPRAFHPRCTHAATTGNIIFPSRGRDFDFLGVDDLHNIYLWLR